MIDFVSINNAALARGRTFLETLIPGGKFRSLEYQVRNPTRDDKRLGSFSINYRTHIWKDFATGDGGGDVISLWAYVRDIGQGEAARELADKLGIPADQPNGGTSTTATEATAQVAAKVFPLGDDSPPRYENEARRHIYKADGKPVAIKIKFNAGGFTQWYRVAGGWQQKKPENYLPVPYTPSGIDPFDQEYDQVLWPEGEKNVDTLGKLGLPAFTFGGVGDGLPNGIDSYLKDRRLVILADNDEPGRAHAEKKTTIAQAAGAATIKIVHFPELPSKGDVSDFIANGGTVEQLFACIDAISFWEPPQGETGSTAKDWRARIVTAKDLQSMSFPPVRHILPAYISEGATIIAGKPKIGKSWLTLDLCLAATANRFTLGTLKPAQGDVLYLALEDNNRRLKRRMNKIWPSTEAAWPKRLALVTEWKRADQGGLDDIEEWCHSVAEPVMITINTLEKFRPIQNGKTAAYSADYEAVTGLQRIASKYSIAVIINHHVRKMEADDPFDTVSGTLGLTGAADTIIVLKRHAGAVTLHARGRDIEEIETALQFERATCRWTILGAASEIYVSNERAAVLNALSRAGPDGLAVSEIMAATDSSNRSAMDTLLFKMKLDGEIIRIKRGIYALAQDGGKIGQKERSSIEAIENIGLNRNLSNLADLTGSVGSALSETAQDAY